MLCPSVLYNGISTEENQASQSTIDCTPSRQSVSVNNSHATVTTCYVVLFSSRKLELGNWAFVSDVYFSFSSRSTVVVEYNKGDS